MFIYYLWHTKNTFFYEILVIFASFSQENRRFDLRGSTLSLLFHDVILDTASAVCLHFTHENKHHLNFCKEGCAYCAYKNKTFCRSPLVPRTKWVIALTPPGRGVLFNITIVIVFVDWKGLVQSAGLEDSELNEGRKKNILWLFFPWGINFIIHLKAEKSWWPAFLISIIFLKSYI